MGPKKKGGKANKLARMTDEQRERYLQHRAAIEEETRRRKEQLIATFMRNKLKREEAFTRINSAKINQHWRHILRKIKCAELQEDVEHLWHSFERIMEQKQSQKEDLLSSLETAERQYSDALQSHLEIVEKLIDVHSDHSNNLKKLFEEQLTELVHSAVDEKAVIHVTFEKETRRIEIMRIAMQMEFEGPERQQQKYERVDKLSEMEKKYEEEWDLLVVDRAKKLEEVWSHIQGCLRSYKANTAAKRKSVQKLHSMEQDWLQTISHIQRTAQRVAQMQEQAENKINDISERNESLCKERDSFLYSYRMLVDRVKREKKKDEEKFHHLIVTSENTLKHLEGVRSRGEKTLALLLLCQRYESDTERKAAVSRERKETDVEVEQSDPTLQRGILNEYEDACDDENTDEEIDMKSKELRVFGKLKNFWKRYNKVLVETSNKRMERDMLALENQQLRSTLRNYLLDMSRVDSCGAPTGHRIANGRPHTSQLPSFRTTIRVLQRPGSSVSWAPSVPSVAACPSFKVSGTASRASSSYARRTASGSSERLSSGSSNSDQWSL